MELDDESGIDAVAQTLEVELRNSLVLNLRRVTRPLCMVRHSTVHREGRVPDPNLLKQVLVGAHRGILTLHVAASGPVSQWPGLAPQLLPVADMIIAWHSLGPMVRETMLPVALLLRLFAKQAELWEMDSRFEAKSKLDPLYTFKQRDGEHPFAANDRQKAAIRAYAAYHTQITNKRFEVGEAISTFEGIALKENIQQLSSNSEFAVFPANQACFELDKAYLEHDGIAKELLVESLLPNSQMRDFWNAQYPHYRTFLGNLSGPQATNPGDDIWAVWADWYEGRLFDGSPFKLPRESGLKIEQRFAVGANRADFWDRPSDAITADVAGWVRDYSPAHKADFDDLPSIFDFQLENGVIQAKFAEGGSPHADFADVTREELTRKLRATADRLRRTQVHAHFPDVLDQIADGIANEGLPLTAGQVLSQFRTWQAKLAALSGPQLSQQVGDDVHSYLIDVNSTFEDYKAAFPVVAKIEASRLALQLQSADAVAVNKAIVEISDAAATCPVVGTSARVALKDLQDEVQRLTDLIEQSPNHKEVALSIETRGTLVSQRAMTTRKFFGRVLKEIGSTVWIGSKEGLKNGVSETIEGSIKGGLALIVDTMLGPLAALGFLLLVFKPLARKADELKKSNDSKDTLTI